MSTFYELKKIIKHTHTHYLVKSISFDDSYTFGCPFKYEPRFLLKLVLLAYSYGIFSYQKNRTFRPGKRCCHVVDSGPPTYRTIALFVISDAVEMMLKSSFSEFRKYLRKNGLIDKTVFIDSTKILANTNRYLFVWKKTLFTMMI